MSTLPFKTKQEDTVPKVDDAVAVGEDLDFQRKWWRFEDAVWCFFLAVLICDLLGLFGRGWLAKAQRSTPDGALTLHYERVERASTPSIMTMDLGSQAVHNGRVQLFVSDSVVKPLGAQRVSPQPQISTIGDGGIMYTFPATHAPMSVQINLQPSFPGVHPFHIQLMGSPAIDARVLVVP
jgi:hypothetical protein